MCSHLSDEGGHPPPGVARRHHAAQRRSRTQLTPLPKSHRRCAMKDEQKSQKPAEPQQTPHYEPPDHALSVVKEEEEGED